MCAIYLYKPTGGYMTKLKYCMVPIVSLLTTNLLAESKNDMLLNLMEWSLLKNPVVLCEYAKDNDFKVTLNNDSGDDYRFIIDQCEVNEPGSVTVVLRTEKWARFTCYELESYTSDSSLYNYSEDSYIDLGNNTYAYFDFDVLRPSNDALNYNWKRNTCDMSTDYGYADTVKLQIDVQYIESQY